jgi:hypothetical protein
LKATLKTYTDTLYIDLSGNQTITGVKTFANIVINGTTKLAGYFYSGTVDPTNTNRVNFDGHLYAKKLYSEALEVAPISSPAFINTPTAPTASAGTNTTQLATTAFAKAVAEGNAIGVGQTWQDVTGSRVSGTIYTNSTGKPIGVFQNGYFSGGGPFTFEINTVVMGSYTYLANGYYSFSFIVPSGATYKITGAITKWAELR